ncbi:beta-defensin 38-like [Apodemus sylvaticus]|uniref:beta-defensin 38-like n=1 Tax=Apodemus sylvaticus TaxID=10129 RepID=UPI00224402FD|nr:beta-defensin 38-like [Apodemus sylvaticus]
MNRPPSVSKQEPQQSDRDTNAPTQTFNPEFVLFTTFGHDTKECIQRKGFCHYFESPWLYIFVGSCYKGKGKCCQKCY